MRHWDLRRGRQLRRYRVAWTAVHDVAFSPAGRSALCAAERAARLRELNTGKERHCFLEKDLPVTRVAFSPAGITVYACGSRFSHGGKRGRVGPSISIERPAYVQLIDPDLGQALSRLEIGGDWFVTLAFYPDGNHFLAMTVAGTPMVIDLHGVVRHCVPPPETRVPWDACLFPNGGVALLHPCTVVCRSPEAPQEIRYVKRGLARLNALAVTPDGKYLLAGGCRGEYQRNERGSPLFKLPSIPPAPIHVWHLRSGRRAGTLAGHEGTTNRLAVSPDGNQVASAGEDGLVCVWNLPQPRTKRFQPAHLKTRVAP